MDIVYFFLCDGFIKIGKVNPHDDEDVADPANEKRVLSRLSGCKTGNPKQIYLLGYLLVKKLIGIEFCMNIDIKVNGIAMMV